MIIKYLKDKDPRNNIHSLIDKKEYVVLGVHFQNNLPCMVVLLNDKDNYPCLFDLQYFDVLDSRIPDGWILNYPSEEFIFFSPKEFVGNFWENFHDSDEESENTFKNVVNKIYSFHGLEPFYKNSYHNGL